MRHRDAIERFFVSRVRGDEALCHELIGETYTSLMKHYGNLREDISIGEERAWVRWICRNVWSHHWRFMANQKKTVPLEEHMAATMPDDDEDANVQLFENIKILASLLPERERMYLHLMAGGHADDDIAVYLDVSRKTVFTTRYRILKRLRAMAERGEIRIENAAVIIDKMKIESNTTSNNRNE